MQDVTTDNKYGVEIYDYKGEDYKTAMSFGSWRVAYLNSGEEFSEGGFHKIERHNETDEVFVLLEGKATLLIGEEINKIEMETHKLYNVPKGVWHHIFVYEGTRVLIVENEDTGKENSDFIYIDKK